MLTIKDDFQSTPMFIKQFLGEVFYKGRGKGYQPKPKTEDLDYSRYHKNLSNNCFKNIYTLNEKKKKKVMFLLLH